MDWEILCTKGEMVANMWSEEVKLVRRGWCHGGDHDHRGVASEY